MALYVIFDILSKYWVRFFIIAILSAVFVVTQSMLAVIFLSKFANHTVLLPVPFLNDFISNQGPIEFGVVIFIAGSMTAAIILLAKLVTVSIMIDYEKYCVERVIDRLKSNKEFTSSLTKNELSLLITKDCRFGGRIAHEVSGLVLPLGIAMFAFPILFYLNTEATIWLILAIGLVVFTQYKLRFRVEDVAKRMETDARKDAKSKAAFFAELMDWAQHNKPMKTDSVQGKVPNPDFMIAYRNRLRIPHFGNFAGGVGFALALSAIAVDFLFNQQSSALGLDLGIYIYVSFFCLSQMRSVSKTFMNYGIFFSYFSRAFRLILGDMQTDKKDESGIQSANIDEGLEEPI